MFDLCQIVRKKIFPKHKLKLDIKKKNYELNYFYERNNDRQYQVRH